MSLNEFRKVLYIGNNRSIGICLPRQFIRVLAIDHGDFVKVRLEERRIVIEKASE